MYQTMILMKNEIPGPEEAVIQEQLQHQAEDQNLFAARWVHLVLPLLMLLQLLWLSRVLLFLLIPPHLLYFPASERDAFISRWFY